jgi:hypothetical protein
MITLAIARWADSVLNHEVTHLAAQRLSGIFVVAEVLAGEDAARRRLV